MKEESVLTVLMYLFKYHMEDDCHLHHSDAEIIRQLEQVGFDHSLILQAFDWLSSLEENNTEYFSSPGENSFRVFSDYEQQFIDLESQRLLLSLEQIGILTPVTREMVIHQLLELIDEDIDVSLVKWVTLIVLFNQPEQSKALQAMEFLVLDETAGGMH